MLISFSPDHRVCSRVEDEYHSSKALLEGEKEKVKSLCCTSCWGYILQLRVLYCITTSPPNDGTDFTCRRSVWYVQIRGDDIRVNHDNTLKFMGSFHAGEGSKTTLGSALQTQLFFHPVDLQLNIILDDKILRLILSDHKRS